MTAKADRRPRRRVTPIFVVYWFDHEDKIQRVAGVYQQRRSAERRLKSLRDGTIQALTLNKRVKFTWEVTASRSERK